MNAAHFPELLAGPIIRRVDRKNAYIWLVTTKSYQIDAKLYTVKNQGLDEEDYEPVFATCDTNTMKFGKNLYVHLLKATPKNYFNKMQLYSYNVQFKRNKEIFDLETLGLLSSENQEAIVYGNRKYPTFFLADSKREAQICYGSCRKLHGKGEDSLSVVDKLIENNHDNLEKRPQSLFLMGDQIYADDVPDPIFPVITSMAEQLIGEKENLPSVENSLLHPPFSSSLYKINGRQFIMEQFCKFSSGKAHNHLMEFGEFAVMYLLSWSPVLWETAQEAMLFQPFEDALQNGLIYQAFSDIERYPNEHAFEMKKLQARFDEQQELLTTFQQPLYKIRRMLANIPVYMIFDDHDITDDWNISSAWKENVYQAPLGRHVVANGLTAYWAFQGWGNDPKAFPQEFTETISKYFSSLITGNKELSDERKSWTKLLLGHQQWYFIAPTSPPAIFFDTRTERQSDTKPKPVKLGRKIEEVTAPPQLIEERQLNDITKKLSDSEWSEGDQLILVSATPVYNMGLMESLLGKLVYKLKTADINVQTKLDFEAWKYNEKGLSTLLKQINEWNPAECIILSGDNHFSATIQANVGFSSGSEVRIQQFISSPMKNKTFTSGIGFILQHAMRLNSLLHQQKLYRYVDYSYSAAYSLNDWPNNAFLWRDRSEYEKVNNNAVILKKNNIGLLSVSHQAVHNQYLHL